jgi:tetratricopeptide (TPR) repeat protein/ferredoxin
VSLPQLAVSSGVAARSAQKSLASGSHATIKRSRASRWRAITLVLVHAAIVAHIVQWFVTGLTVSPVEPSESMYALEVGKVNAGFVFFVVAIACTLVFGRFFCGWGCHIVALQDLCSHWMTRLGVRPKPFRTRLLAWAPVGLAIYMFVWPTFRREALRPAVAALRDWGLSQASSLGLLPEAVTSWVRSQPAMLPWFMGEVAPFPGFRNALITEDYWATFPPWFVTIPFLLVCTFGIVYFLGSKGFCTYGCPYGGVFGPVDRFSPGRIVVNDSCEGCGHCTAVCTSNVRVHQEVRDFGMVVDAGCMKCMDCVSVCPNNALSFGFATPPAFGGGMGTAGASSVAGDAGSRAKPSARSRRGGFSLASLFSRKAVRHSQRPAFDLSPRAELLLALVAFASFWSFRGFLGLVPMLMAAALGAMHAFCLWKLLCMVRVPNVRLQNLQLRAKGRVTRAGWVFAIATLATTATALWAGLIKLDRTRAEAIDASILTPQATVFAAGYVPREHDKQAAEAALRRMLRSGSSRDAQLAANASQARTAPRALGWEHAPATLIRMGWLAAVAGDSALAERALREATLRGRVNPEVLQGVASLLRGRGAPREEFEGVLKASLEAQPKAQHVRVMLAQLRASSGDTQSARTLIDEVFAAGRHAEEGALRGAAELQARLGDVPGARARLEEAVAKRPLAASARVLAANLAAAQRDFARALELAREARAIEPRNPAHVQLIAGLLAAQGKPDEAVQTLEAWIRTGRAGVPERQQLIQLLLGLRQPEATLPHFDAIARALPFEPGPLLDKAATLRSLGREEEAAQAEQSAAALGRP